MGESIYPVEMLKLQRAWIRLEPGDPERAVLASRIGRLEAGHLGEETVARYLIGTKMPCQWTILRNIRLRIREGYVAQFDFIVITERGILIVEVKGIKGELAWREHPRRLERREQDGSLLTLDCPMTQVENQVAGMTDWLADKGLYLPVTGVAVFTLRNTWINLPHGAPIISVKELPAQMKKMHDEAPPPSQHSTRVHTLKEHILAEQLGPAWVLEHDRYDPLRIRTGLICEHCHSETGRRICPFCKRKADSDPLEMALLDYFLLIRPTITNSAFRAFTGIRSTATANRFLNRYELKSSGTTKGRTYTFSITQHLNGRNLIPKKPEHR